MCVTHTSSKKLFHSELVFSEQYLKQLPEEVQDFIFELLNPKELANCCGASRNWEKKIKYLIEASSTVQTITLLLMRKVLIFQPHTIKAPYLSWPVMDASHGKVAYNTLDKDYRDKKFILFDIATKKGIEVSTPPRSLINYNFLKLSEKHLILGDSTSLSFNTHQQESEKKETESKQYVEKQLTYQTGLGRHAYHEGMQIAAGVGYQDQVITIDQQGKGLFHIPINEVSDYTGQYLRNAINIMNNAVVIAFQFYCNPEGTQNIVHVDSYSLETRKLIYRIPFVNEKISMSTPIVSNEKRIAIAFHSAGWLYLMH